jgi:F-type H+-transporting ATPase subunit b
VQAERQKIEDMRRDIMDKARAEAQRVADDTLAKAKADIQADRERLRREMQTARDQAMMYLRDHQVDLVTQAASKVIGREMTGDDHRRLVDEALVELRQAGEAWRDSTVGVA